MRCLPFTWKPGTPLPTSKNPHQAASFQEDNAWYFEQCMLSTILKEWKLDHNIEDQKMEFY